MEEIFTLLSGIVFRLGIPILVTALVVILLKRLDIRWQAEVQEQKARSPMLIPLPAVRCWEVNQCSETKRASCKAYQNQNVPCWQQFRSSDGHLKNECIDCQVFRDAPIPVLA